jgi:hypothetical protein
VAACRWNLSAYKDWDGLAFPEQILDSAPTAITHERTLSFSRHALVGSPSSYSGVESHTASGWDHAWAAVVSAELCTSAPALLQQLDLRASPGTELLVNGMLVARTRSHVSTSTAFPRGPETATPFVRWVSRGCDHVQLRMYDPPRCPAGHAESVLPTLESFSAPVTEVRIAHSNTSIILCASSECSDTEKFPIDADMRQLVVHLSWHDRTLRQGVGHVDADGVEHAPADWVRPALCLRHCATEQSASGDACMN